MTLSRYSAVVMTACLLATGVLAQPAEKGKGAVKPDNRPSIHAGQQGMHQDRYIQRMKAELALSDEQVKKIEAIHQEARQKIVVINQNRINDELRDAMKLAPDSKEYAAETAKAADIAAQNASARIATMAETRKKVYAVLDDGQKQKFLAMKPQQPPRDRQQLREKSAEE